MLLVTRAEIVSLHCGVFTQATRPQKPIPLVWAGLPGPRVDERQQRRRGVVLAERNLALINGALRRRRWHSYGDVGSVGTLVPLDEASLRYEKIANFMAAELERIYDDSFSFCPLWAFGTMRVYLRASFRISRGE